MKERKDIRACITALQESNGLRGTGAHYRNRTIDEGMRGTSPVTCDRVGNGRRNVDGMAERTRPHQKVKDPGGLRDSSRFSRILRSRSLGALNSCLVQKTQAYNTHFPSSVPYAFPNKSLAPRGSIIVEPARECSTKRMRLPSFATRRWPAGFQCVKVNLTA